MFVLFYAFCTYLISIVGVQMYKYIHLTYIRYVGMYSEKFKIGEESERPRAGNHFRAETISEQEFKFFCDLLIFFLRLILLGTKVSEQETIPEQETISRPETIRPDSPVPPNPQPLTYSMSMQFHNPSLEVSV